VTSPPLNADGLTFIEGSDFLRFVAAVDGEQPKLTLPAACAASSEYPPDIRAAARINEATSVYAGTFQKELLLYKGDGDLGCAEEVETFSEFPSKNVIFVSRFDSVNSWALRIEDVLGDSGAKLDGFALGENGAVYLSGQFSNQLSLDGVPMVNMSCNSTCTFVIRLDTIASVPPSSMTWGRVFTTGEVSEPQTTLALSGGFVFVSGGFGAEVRDEHSNEVLIEHEGGLFTLALGADNKDGDGSVYALTADMFEPELFMAPDNNDGVWVAGVFTGDFLMPVEGFSFDPIPNGSEKAAFLVHVQ
ncbi:MAG: hypothetical protein ACPG4T_14770, partial [Nannocystaceae bacterium]